MNKAYLPLYRLEELSSVTLRADEAKLSGIKSWLRRNKMHRRALIDRKENGDFVVRSCTTNEWWDQRPPHRRPVDPGLIDKLKALSSMGSLAVPKSTIRTRQTIYNYMRRAGITGRAIEQKEHWLVLKVPAKYLNKKPRKQAR